ncbi:MAG: hypothetical protein RLZZ267_302, partial [Bacillota bacterium]
MKTIKKLEASWTKIPSSRIITGSL